jgi:hypothetical protein
MAGDGGAEPGAVAWLQGIPFGSKFLEIKLVASRRTQEPWVYDDDQPLLGCYLVSSVAVFSGMGAVAEIGPELDKCTDAVSDELWSTGRK